MIVWLGAAWISAAFAADCPAPTAQIDITEMLERAQVSYRELDSDGFYTHLDSAMLDLPCLADVLSTHTVADIHRIQAVALYGKGNSGGTITAFAAANAIDPQGGLSNDLVPDGHELLVLSRTLLNSDTVRLDPPASNTRLLIDGETTRFFPIERPVLAQVVRANTVTTTVYLLPGDSFPAYEKSRAPRTQRAVLFGAAGVTAATSVLLYGVARSQGSVLRSGDIPAEWTRDDVDSRRTSTNTLTSTSIVGAVMSSGLLTVAILR
jgi:hypothetical protein